MLWLHRRSEEPSVTETVCYWKRSTLANVSASGISLRQLLGAAVPELGPKDPSVVQDCVNSVKGASERIFDIYAEPKYKHLSIFQFMLAFKSNIIGTSSPDDFIDFAGLNINDDLCVAAQVETKLQSKSFDWHELRFGSHSFKKF